MTSRALASLVLRVWGVILLAEALAWLPLAVYVVTLSRHLGPVSPGTIPAIAGQCLAGLALVILADPIVRRAIADDSPPGVPLDAGRFATTAVSAVGILIVIDSLRRILVAASTLAWPTGLSADFVSRLHARSREQIASSLVLLVAGVMILRWRNRAAAFAAPDDA